MARSVFRLCANCLAKTLASRPVQSRTSLFHNIHTFRPPQPNLKSYISRRHIQTQEFKPFVPPSPESLPKAAPARTYRRTRRWTRRLLYLALGLGTAYEIDQYFLYASLTRSARTFWLGLLVATDYKINFRAHPPLADSIQALHNRNAERLFDLLRTNGGLYLKIGQAIAMQVDATRFNICRPKIAEVPIVSYPAPRISKDVFQDVRRCSPE